VLGGRVGSSKHIPTFLCDSNTSIKGFIGFILCIQQDANVKKKLKHERLVKRKTKEVLVKKKHTW
jgi:hypothetical protein